MKILQVNCVYESGSTGKITAEIHRALLGQGIDSVVCYGRRQKTQEPHVYKTCGELESHVEHFFANAVGPMYGGCYPATARLIRRIEKEKPDVVHLQCINGYFVNIYALIRWLKAHRIRTVLTLHAEFMYTANCGHALDCEKWRTGCGHCPRWKQETGAWCFDRTAESWKRMQRAFSGFEEDLTVVSVSPWLKSRAEESPILKDFRHVVIYNGLNTEVFRPRETGRLREQMGLSGKPIVFHATPAFCADPGHIKGGYYVLALAGRMPEVTFLVAGPCDEGLEAPDNVILLGKVSDQELLAQYYSMADVTLLTSKKETFSMVTAESLCCGTPVAGFRAGAPEQIALPEYSRFTAHGDLDGLQTSVESFLHRPKEERTAALAMEQYASRTMTQKYIQLYQQIK